MKWKWLRKKARRDRSRDFNRHFRVAQRLVARMDDAIERGDIDRVKVIAKRIHHVRDIQISDLGH